MSVFFEGLLDIAIDFPLHFLVLLVCDEQSVAGRPYVMKVVGTEPIVKPKSERALESGEGEATRQKDANQ